MASGAFRSVIDGWFYALEQDVLADPSVDPDDAQDLLKRTDVRTFVSHASLSAAERKQAEAAFAEEKDCVIVATSTLELGIDVGDLDRVIQIDSPSTVSSFLQRMGRTGRRTGGVRNCLFLTTNQDAFMLALGVTQLWSQAWVEAARPPDEPWPIVGQQILVSTLERGEWPASDVIALLSRCFPELPEDGFQLMVTHMVQQGYLDSSEGLLRIGPQAERDYGRGHYRDLLASFSGAQLLTGRHGSAEVGYIDPTVLTGDEPQRLLLLAGRSWMVKEIEWSKKIVWLEPAKEGGKARWMGGARSLSREVCQGIRVALIHGVSPAVHLSLRGKSELAALQEELALSPDADFMSRAEGNQVRSWTFAGTKQNRTYARTASSAGKRVKFDALSVQAPAASLLSQNGGEADVKLTADEVELLAEGIKFSACVPAKLLGRAIAARLFVVKSNPV